MTGGFNKWKDEGRPWSAPKTLTPAQRNRYQRHLLLPEIGEVGQLKLLDSKVLLLGAVLAAESHARCRSGDLPARPERTKDPSLEYLGGRNGSHQLPARRGAR